MGDVTKIYAVWVQQHKDVAPALKNPQINVTAISYRN